MAFARPEPRIARRLAVFMPLPPASPTLAINHGHIVKDINASTKNPGWLRITTNFGDWEAHPDVLFDFPRRPDGTTKDWRKEDRDPLPRELAIGDTLPPNTTPMWERQSDDEELQFLLKTAKVAKYEDLPEYIKQDHEKKYDASAQEVTAIWATKHSANEWYVMCYDKAVRANRQYVCHTELPLTFPRLPKARVPGIAREDAELITYGPYEHISKGDGRYLFAVHPYGRGRWPAFLKEVDNNALILEDGEIRATRHPVVSWSKFNFVPDPPLPDVPDFDSHIYERHPKDPRRFGKGF